MCAAYPIYTKLKERSCNIVMSTNVIASKELTSKTSWKHDFLMNWRLYLLALPVVLYFLIFNYLPMGGLIMAFQDYTPTKGIFSSEWVGFKNFIDFFTAPNFLQILRNTFVISLLSLVIAFPLTIVFALLVNEITSNVFKRTVQTISYLPYFIPVVVVCGLIIDFVSSTGAITNILVSLGLERQNLLLNPKYFWWINLASEIWQGLGYGSIIYIAAITNVNPELYEAAYMDGANRFKRMWHITIPGIMPTIIVMLILRCGLIMTVGFDKILLLYNPNIYATADVISTYVVRMGIERMQYGYATAVGLFNSIVGTALFLGSNALARKYTESSIM